MVVDNLPHIPSCLEGCAQEQGCMHTHRKPERSNPSFLQVRGWRWGLCTCCKEKQEVEGKVKTRADLQIFWNLNTLPNSNKDLLAKDRRLIDLKCLNTTLLSYAHTGVIPKKPGWKWKTKLPKKKKISRDSCGCILWKKSQTDRLDQPSH